MFSLKFHPCLIRRRDNTERLTVPTGKVFGFLGPNGAGKTTTMHVRLGFIQATAGSASIFGTDVRESIARQRIGYLTAQPKVMQPDRNDSLAQSLLGDSRHAIGQHFYSQCDLYFHRGVPIFFLATLWRL